MITLTITIFIFLHSKNTCIAIFTNSLIKIASWLFFQDIPELLNLNRSRLLTLHRQFLQVFKYINIFPITVYKCISNLQKLHSYFNCLLQLLYLTNKLTALISHTLLLLLHRFASIYQFEDNYTILVILFF